MSIVLQKTWEVEGVLTDVTSMKLSDATETYGVKRNDTDAVVVADDTSMTKVSTGVYEYTFDEPEAGLTYTAQIEVVYDGQTSRFEVDLVGSPAAVDTAMTVSYSQLKERIGRAFFGKRTGWTADETDDIDDAIKDGLHDVYLAHEWSFLRPRYTITTTSGDYTYDLPSAYDAIDGSLTFAADLSDYYPPLERVQESEIRRLRSNNEYSDRPTKYAVVSLAFDSSVGSKRGIELYPTPDAAYVLTAIMRLRTTMIDNDHPYPLGGEVLASVIIEACLAAAEKNLEDAPGVHFAQYQKLLAAAIQIDKEASSPDTIGFGSMRTECLGPRLVGTLTYEGDEL